MKFKDDSPDLTKGKKSTYSTVIQESGQEINFYHVASLLVIHLKHRNKSERLNFTTSTTNLIKGNRVKLLDCSP